MINLRLYFTILNTLHDYTTLKHTQHLGQSLRPRLGRFSADRIQSPYKGISVKEVWSTSTNQNNIIQVTCTMQFGTNTTQPWLPAATRSNEAHILKNCSPTFASVLYDGSTKTQDLWLLAKAHHANSKSAFPTVTQQQFLQLQLLAVTTWMIGDLDFLCSTARCTQPSTKHEQYAWIYICKIKSQKERKKEIK